MSLECYCRSNVMQRLLQTVPQTIYATTKLLKRNTEFNVCASDEVLLLLFCWWYKARFYKAFNNIFGKIGRNASEEVLFALLKSKCLPILCFGVEVCPTNSADLQSLQFTMNKILFKIFGAMSKEMLTEISKFFGINP